VLPSSAIQSGAPRTETWEAPNSDSVTALGGGPTVSAE
jgi:hypothetical protein